MIGENDIRRTPYGIVTHRPEKPDRCGVHVDHPPPRIDHHHRRTHLFDHLTPGDRGDLEEAPPERRFHIDEAGEHQGERCHRQSRVQTEAQLVLYIKEEREEKCDQKEGALAPVEGMGLRLDEDEKEETRDQEKVGVYYMDLKPYSVGEDEYRERP